MQKTAYELRISDWSSDVCSSDLREERMLHEVRRAEAAELLRAERDQHDRPRGALAPEPAPDFEQRRGPRRVVVGAVVHASSEERRVGKEGVSTCRSRWSPSPYKQYENA